ncbi:MAG: hypothetical protein HRU19_31885 [Pseudobacteriovorax sp.]|nr:hypothetical protein [Pseudobacteriovorax sp.]
MEHMCIDVTENYEEEMKVAAKENPANLPMQRDKAGLALEVARRWKNGRTIRIKFMNGSNVLKKRIKEAAETWLEYINLKFEWVESGPSDVRIYTTTGDGSWSYIGTSALRIAQNKPTMQFGWLTERSSDLELSRVVIHEFGHMLGFIHEHQNPVDNPIIWDEEEVYRRYRGAPNYWTDSEIRTNILNRYRRDQINASSYDPDSIMIYSFPSSLTKNGVSSQWNSKLSQQDIAMAKQFYPKKTVQTLTLTIGTEAKGEITSAGEKDIAKFEIDQMDFYTLRTTGSTDTKIALYKDDTLIVSDFDNGVNSNAEITTLLTPGEYTLIIQHRDEGTGKYGLKLDRSSVFVPYMDPREKSASIEEVATVGIKTEGSLITFNAIWHYEEVDSARLQFKLAALRKGESLCYYSIPALIDRKESRNLDLKFSADLLLENYGIDLSELDSFEVVLN